MPTNGISKPSSAKDGMVCNILVNCNTASAARRLRANNTAAGTAMATAASKASPESHKCVSSICQSSARVTFRDENIVLIVMVSMLNNRCLCLLYSKVLAP